MALLGAKEFFAIGISTMKPALLQMKSLVCNIFNEHYK
jgi:hypothetical protein